MLNPEKILSDLNQLEMFADSIKKLCNSARLKISGDFYPGSPKGARKVRRSKVLVNREKGIIRKISNKKATAITMA